MLLTPTLLVSLPMCTGAAFTHRFLAPEPPGYPQPSVTPSVLGMPTGPLGGSVPAFGLPPISPIPMHPTTSAPLHSLPKMILSPVPDPIPYAFVHHVQSGQFIKMRDLLTDNISLLNQLASLHDVVTLPASNANHTRLREIPSLVSQLYCFICLDF